MNPDSKPHSRYLQDCFRRQLRLPLEGPVRVDIYSYQDKRVATGYQRVITTWQGMYFELRYRDVDWGQVAPRNPTMDGVNRWTTDGVTIYQPTYKPQPSKVLRHRFAMMPPDTFRGDHNPQRDDRYYIHVYQTKVGTDRRSLRSREMARELERRWTDDYYPRAFDVENRQVKPRTYVDNAVRDWNRNRTGREQKDSQWRKNERRNGRGNLRRQNEGGQGTERNRKQWTYESERNQYKSERQPVPRERSILKLEEKMDKLIQIMEETVAALH